MSRLRFLFAWLVLAALPLQGFAGAAMLFCGQGAPASQAQAVMPAHQHAGNHDDMQAAAHDGGQQHAHAGGTHDGSPAPMADPGCPVCAANCHSSAMPAAVPALGVVAVALPPVVQAGPAAPSRPAPVPDKPPRA